MSSQADIQALDAKIARLEAELEVEREQSASRLKAERQQSASRVEAERQHAASRLEVEQRQSASRIDELEQKVKKLEIDKRLSAPKPDNRGARSEVSTGASNPAQQAQISQLREELATKDAELATKDATIEQLFEAVSFLRTSLIGYRTVTDQAQQGMKAVKQCWEDIMDDCVTARNDIQFVYEQTRHFERPIFASEQDNATSPLSEDTGPSSSRTAKLTRDGASEPRQPSPKSTTAEPAADAASGPPRLPPRPTVAEPAADATSDLLQALQLSPTATIPTTNRTPEPPQPAPSAQTAAKTTASDDAASTTKQAMDYAQAVKTKRERTPYRLPYGRAKIPLEQNPLFAMPVVTHADFSAKKEAARQTHFQPPKPQTSQRSNKASKRGGSTRGRNARGNEDRGGRGDRKPEKGENL